MRVIVRIRLNRLYHVLSGSDVLSVLRLRGLGILLAVVDGLSGGLMVALAALVLLAVHVLGLAVPLLSLERFTRWNEHSRLNEDLTRQITIRVRGNLCYDAQAPHTHIHSNNTAEHTTYTHGLQY